MTSVQREPMVQLFPVTCHDYPYTCHVCGHRMAWWADGVSGCRNRCGAASRSHAQRAERLARNHHRNLPRLARQRADAVRALGLTPTNKGWR